MKKFFFLMLIFGSLYSESNLPQIIDTKEFNIINPELFDFQLHLKGKDAFNNAPECIPFFHYLRDEYRVQTVVETGTLFGFTTLILGSLFNEVHTIEINPAFSDFAYLSYQSLTNIRFHKGSSENILKKLLPSLEHKFTLFYLDAHWENHWPLLEELEQISHTHKNKCIIVIDDVKVPDRPEFDFDTYNNDECSFDYVKPLLDKIYTNYTTHYLLPCKVNSRAKLVVIPNLD